MAGVTGLAPATSGLTGRTRADASPSKTVGYADRHPQECPHLRRLREVRDLLAAALPGLHGCSQHAIDLVTIAQQRVSAVITWPR